LNQTVKPTGSTGLSSEGVRAVLLVVASAFFFATGHAGAKYLTTDMHPFVIAFWRNLFALMPFLPWIARKGLRSMHTNRIGFHFFRALANAASMIFWFTALSMMALADATALSMLGPLFAMLFAALFLQEKIGPRRWWALVFGMAGALVIVRPGFEAVGMGAILVLLRGVAQGINKVMAKSLTKTEDTGVIVAYLLILATPITLLPALFYWQWPTIPDLVVLIGMGAVGAIANICMVKAYGMVDVSVVEPITFTRLIWAAVLGYMIFAEFPDYWTWIGGAMIVAATSYVSHREARAKKAKSAD
jgi:drug/metabolite transporter (DMT)-like permease